MKLCECGCGNQTSVITLTNNRKGRIKGEYNRFVVGHTNKGKRGAATSKWKGGITVHADGYILLKTHGNPRGGKNKYMLQHILVAEQALGHPLPPKAVVHHVNEIKDDNRNCNLVICENEAYHRLLHARLRAYRATGSVHGVHCHLCGVWGMPEDIPGRRGGSRFHRECGAAFEREQSRKRRQRAITKETP